MLPQSGIVSSTNSTKKRVIDIRQLGKFLTLWEISEHIRLSKAQVVYHAGYLAGNQGKNKGGAK
jgi:predicted transcriptional regulator